MDPEVLVGEFLSVDGSSAGAVAVGEVSALQNEPGDHAVELGALVALHRTLPGAQLPEVL